jgi:hypothetical protein
MPGIFCYSFPEFLLARYLSVKRIVMKKKIRDMQLQKTSNRVESKIRFSTALSTLKGPKWNEVGE